MQNPMFWDPNDRRCVMGFCLANALSQPWLPGARFPRPNDSDLQDETSFDLAGRRRGATPTGGRHRDHCGPSPEATRWPRW